MNKRTSSRFAPEWLTAFVWRLSYLKSLLTGRTATITRETARNAHEINQFDNRKFLLQFPDFSYELIDNTIKRVAGALFR